MNQPQSTRLLIVEDDASLATMIADFLHPFGFEVSIEGRGDSAVDRIVDEAPAMVILDINLPGLDGFSVCRSVRPRYSGPIIILSARGEVTDKVVGLEAGADDYMAKPVQPRALLACLESHLRGVEPDAPTRAAVTNGLVR